MPALPILQILWANRQVIAQVGAVLILIALLWWFGIHNPRVIKNQAAEISRLSADREAAYGAINLLTSIEGKHAEIDQNSNSNIQRIRTGRAPGVRGVFVSDGVLPSVFESYSTAR